jgi:hypothetical protein
LENWCRKSSQPNGNSVFRKLAKETGVQIIFVQRTCSCVSFHCQICEADPLNTHTHLQIRDTHESHKPSRSACFVDFQSSWEAKCGCTSLLTAHEDFTSESQIYKCEVAFIAVIFILRLVFLIFMAFLPFMFLFDFIASAIGLCLSCGVYAYSNRKDQGQAGFGACG